MKRVLLLSIVVFFNCGLVYGQVVEELTPLEKKYQSPVQEPLTTYKGFFRTGLSAGYNVIDKIFLENGKRQSLKGNTWGNVWNTSSYVRYGITNRFQVDIIIPYLSTNIFFSTSFQVPLLDTAWVSRWNVTGNGIGDIGLAFAYQIIEGSYTRPALGFFLDAVLPSGQKNIKEVDPDNANDFKKPSGNGEFSLSPVLVYRKINYPFSYNIYSGYRMYFEGQKIIESTDKVERKFKSGNLLYFGGSFNFHMNDWLIFKNVADINFRNESREDGKKSAEPSWYLMYYPALNFQIRQFRIGESLSIPLMGKFYGADIGYTLSLQYVF